MEWTRRTDDDGFRTWFGTLTLAPSAQREALDEAFMQWADRTGMSGADWWEEEHCDERFRLVRLELVEWVKRYWKRLRKGVKRCRTCYPQRPRKKDEWDHPPAKFKYFLVFERHKSGLPHMHFLLHEQSHILLKHLDCAWPHGFTKVKVVRGDHIEKAAFYVSKYLGKAYQARQIASVRYARDAKPPDRARSASNKNPDPLQGEVSKEAVKQASVSARRRSRARDNAPARVTPSCAGVMRGVGDADDANAHEVNPQSKEHEDGKQLSEIDRSSEGEGPP